MLKGKTALVTGASKGLGKAIAIEFAKNNADIIINYNNDKEGAQEVENEIKKFGRKAISFKADVSKYDQVKTMMESVKAEFGKLDILVNNAGVIRDRTLKNMELEEWNDVIDINLNGVFNVTKHALPLMQKNGRIINISSIAGLIGNFGQCNYSASKAGIIGFTKSLAKELGKNDITVNAIAPGFLKSDMTDRIPFLRRKLIMSLIPLGRPGLNEEIAYCALFLASERASYITGEVLNVNGGIGL